MILDQPQLIDWLKYETECVPECLCKMFWGRAIGGMFLVLTRKPTGDDSDLLLCPLLRMLCLSVWIPSRLLINWLTADWLTNTLNENDDWVLKRTKEKMKALQDTDHAKCPFFRWSNSVNWTVWNNSQIVLWKTWHHLDFNGHWRIAS